MDHKETQKAYSKIVAKAWADPAFKERLRTETAAVLKENGLVFPDGMEFKFVENTSRLFHFVLPPVPDADALQVEDHDERLSASSSGTTTY